MEKNIPQKANGESVSMTEEFLRLLMANYKRIYTFILTLVPKSCDADDLMQETTTIMWRRFGDFDPDGDFGAWGVGIAHYRILEYRRKQANTHIRFSDVVFSLIADDSRRLSLHVSAKIEAIEDCVAKLGMTDRDLIRKRYEQNSTLSEIARHFGKSVSSIHRSLGRVHEILIQCVRRTLAAEEIQR